MKESKYNFFVPYNERIICFNGMSGKVFSTSKEEFSTIENQLKNPDDKNQLSSFLYENKFITDNDVEETDLLIANNRVAVFENTYHLIINPTQECCFNCWYCYQSRVKGHMSNDTIESVKKFIKNRVEKKEIGGLLLGWFGGEPLLYFHEVIYPISIYAKKLMDQHKLEYKTNITTNGYLITSAMIEKFKEIGLNVFQITFDGNEESHNKTHNFKGKASFDIIIENIIQLCKEIENVRITLRVNYTDEIIAQDYEAILNRFPSDIRSKMSVNFQRIWQSSDEIHHPGTDNAILLKAVRKAREMGFRLMEGVGFFIQKPLLCYADRYNFAHINFDGKVYKCTARDYSEKLVCGELVHNGEINWKQGYREKMVVRANFDNELCLGCKQLPLCMGPCFQTYLDYKNNSSKNFCSRRAQEIAAETIIIEHYKTVKNRHLKN